MALSQKGAAFVEYVLADEKLNAYKAAIKAGYAETTAKKCSYQWIQDDKNKCTENYWPIWEAYQAAKKARNERNNIDADYVLRRLIEIDEMDVLDIMNDDMTLKPLNDWPKAWRTTVTGIDVMEIAHLSDVDKTEAMLKKIKWPDKVKNLELLGKHVSVQAFKDKHEIDGDLTMNLISEISARNAEQQRSPLPQDNITPNG
ncbi:terminase small subunit [Gayadomonas joobiniege]|uniref:terminase small subunit n=1 Tax=Gayadomonas joobiniege TaxID=1234606 RepID=UPI000377FDC1|nr:terminase small subunit [Gayadomonas joobiniege]